MQASSASVNRRATSPLKVRSSQNLAAAANCGKGYAKEAQCGLWMSIPDLEARDIPPRRLAVLLPAWLAMLILVPIAGSSLHIDDAAIFTVDFVISMLFMMRLWYWSAPGATV